MTPARTVLVTGAAKRLGRAIALHLAGAGWNVAIHYHGSAAEAEEVAAAARASGVKAATFKANLSREEETAALVGRAAAELGPLTALVNSALPKPTDSKVNSKSVRGKKQGLLGVMQAL